MAETGMSLAEARAYLRSSTQHGALNLFTGAGFSLGALDRRGRHVPSAWDLKAAMWKLIADSDVDDSMTLPDIFDAAQRGARNRLTDLLKSVLSVDPTSLPQWYETWFSFPWQRAYTLNIDDLEQAALRAFDLPRRVVPKSALRERSIDRGVEELMYLHLNGDLQDVPDVTFSAPQYGHRIAAPEVFWDWLVADLLASPVVFVGTNLDEPPLWQYLALRQSRGPRGVQEHRPRSLLVSPRLPEPRRILLEGFNIKWVQADAESFAEEVLAHLATEAEQGRRALRTAARVADAPVSMLPVTELIARPVEARSRYLEGAQPTWSDVRSERVAARVFEEKIPLESTGVILIDGTRGAGVSTTLMRSAIRASAAGRRVLWAEHAEHANAADLDKALRAESGDVVVFVDDADMFGYGLQAVVDDYVNANRASLVVLGMRAPRVDEVLPDWVDGAGRREIPVPLLEREDVEAVIRCLEVENRLGELVGLSHAQQVASLEAESGRQLLVAMIKATSGEELEDKARDEYCDLSAIPRAVYLSVALATDLRHRIDKRDVLIAGNAELNEGLHALDRMVARGLLIEDGAAGYRARHRIIAELVIAVAATRGELKEAYVGLITAVALRYERVKRRSADFRAIKILIGNRRLSKLFSREEVREIYQRVESSLEQDHHYWLQRGAYEVREENLGAARRYLSNARGRSQQDPWVEIEWAYLLLKEACAGPNEPGAVKKWADGEATLLDFIEREPYRSEYPFHILGRQTLSWLHASAPTRDDRRQQLERLQEIVEKGLRYHPGNVLLMTLRGSIRSEYFSLAVE